MIHEDLTKHARHTW